jgi:hypothetical protein
MNEAESEKQAKIAFKRMYDAISVTLDGEDPLVAFGTILSFLTVLGHANDFTIHRMKDQLQYFLKMYAEFLERRKGK